MFIFTVYIQLNCTYSYIYLQYINISSGLCGVFFTELVKMLS